MIFKFIILGIIQGLTEFLPISSSGHLILTQKILGFTSNEFLFDIAVHFGTLLSVIIFFKKKLYSILKEFFLSFRKYEYSKIKIPFLIVIGSIPAAIIGFSFRNYINVKLWNLNVTIICFVITGFCLFFSEKFYKESKDIKSLSIHNALIIGIFQSFALLPGISRSGFTISAGITSGLRRNEAFEFSFLLAIPVILGSIIFSLKEILSVDKTLNFVIHTIAGIIVACISGLFALKILKTFLKNKKLYIFSIYLWLLSTIILVSL